MSTKSIPGFFEQFTTGRKKSALTKIPILITVRVVYIRLSCMQRGMEITPICHVISEILHGTRTTCKMGKSPKFNVLRTGPVTQFNMSKSAFRDPLNLYPNLVSSNPSQSIIFDSIGKRLSSPFTIENRLISSGAVWMKDDDLANQFSLNTYWKKWGLSACCNCLKLSRKNCVFKSETHRIICIVILFIILLTQQQW